MLFEVNLPSLSPTMEEGKIVKWVKKKDEHENAMTTDVEKPTYSFIKTK